MLPESLQSRTAGGREPPLMGIPEWMCYYINYNAPGGDRPEAIDECIDLHLDAGIGALVWNCGRSVVDYWTKLPDATQQCEEGMLAGGRDWTCVAKVMDEVCPLRRATERCRKRGAPLLGRLGMNRHYGGRKYTAITSRFAREHPEYYERSRLGNDARHKLCYAIPEVRRERIDILLEIQRIGVDALVLDFCRQMPMIMYHDAVVQPYIAKTGIDPRAIDSASPDDYADWFQYRADIMTGFLRELTDEVRQQEEELGRPCPIIARVPDNAPWLMIAFGLDVARWCREDLVDGTMLSPFPIALDDPGRYPEYHVSVAHESGKFCIGGVGSKNVIVNEQAENTGFFAPKPVYEIANRQCSAGVDAMSLYQSESLVRMDYLQDLIREIGDPKLVARRAEELPDPGFAEDYFIGVDWHSNLIHSVDVNVAGDQAL